jgi:hypothetical protein
LLIFAALSAGSIVEYRRLAWGSGTYEAAAIAAMFALGIAGALVSRAGLRVMSRVTAMAVVVSVAAVIRLAAPVIDATKSARPIAEDICSFSREPAPVALYRVHREQEYGLEFYLNRPAQSYESGNVPGAAHVLVAAQNTRSEIAQIVAGRRVSFLTSIPAQKLDLYWVAAGQ